MLFNGDNDFTNRVVDSFGRFGMKVEQWEKGQSKNVLRFTMSDTIHDSGYVAVAVQSAAGKKAEKVWDEIIKKDLIPAMKGYDGEPAAALIIPTQDADKVVEIFRKKGFTPTVYQLFPGYIVAGFQKREAAKFLEEEKTVTEAQTVKAEPPPPLSPDEELTAEKIIAETQNKKEIISTPEKGPEQGQSISLKKKLAAAALLGISIGLIPFGVKAILNDTPENGAQIETAAEQKIADRYFTGMKNGTPEDNELLKYLASNPQLAAEELERLANTPVGTEVAKNPKAPSNIIEEASLSADENMRASAGSNPEASQKILQRLSRDISPKVRGAVARNPAITRDIMERLAKDTPEVKENLLENNQLPPDILDTVSQGAARTCDFNKKMMANPCMPPSTLAYNADNPDACIRAGVAANPNTPSETVDKLTNDPLPEVRTAAWKNPKISQSKINSIFKPGWMADNNQMEEDARKAALENPSLDESTLEKAALTDPEKYARSVAQNKAAPAPLINRMKNIADGKGGLNKFIDNAMAIKNNPAAIADLNNIAENSGENISVPLRKALNESFMKNVYNPYRFVADMRKFKTLKGNGSGGSSFTIKSPFLDLYSKTSAPIDIPEKFSEFPKPEPEKNSSDKEKSAEKAAFDTADAIVESVMDEILPSINKSLSTGNTKRLPAVSNNGTSAGGSSSGFIAPTSGGLPNDGNYPASSGVNGDKSQWLFQNACERIDGLQSMF